MAKAVSPRGLDFYKRKLDAMLSVQPCVYMSELFPHNGPATERFCYLKQLRELEEYYVLEQREVRFFKEFSEYEKARLETAITAEPNKRLTCLTLTRPSGVKISIWPDEVNRLITVLQNFQRSLATRKYIDEDKENV